MHGLGMSWSVFIQVIPTVSCLPNVDEIKYNKNAPHQSLRNGSSLTLNMRLPIYPELPGHDEFLETLPPFLATKTLDSIAVRPSHSGPWFNF